MYLILIVTTILVLFCIFTSKILYRFGVPALLLFLAIGMLMGSDGIGGIYFDNFVAAEYISSLALALIIFYGGFDTKWRTAKPVAVKASLLSSFGTGITAVVTGVFCHFILGVPILYGMLFGAITSSTDAAAVFSIFRSRNLNLKAGLAPMLEVESGSNDPFAYMITILIITALGVQDGGSYISNILFSLVTQIGLAIVLSAVFSVFTIYVLKNLQIEVDGFYPILLLAIVILCYSISMAIGANGLLSVYILGIVVGNSSFIHKISLIHFFDGVSWLMQMALFFVMGLLSFPSQLPDVILPGILLSMVIIFIARPLSVLCILGPFKTPLRQQAFVAWVGLRGAASIVFAIMAVQNLGYRLPYDLFHMVFFVALVSILLQGSLTPFVADKLDMLSENEDDSVLKTFNDYFEDIHEEILEHKLLPGDKLLDKRIVDASIPDNLLIVMIKRGNGIVIPKGTTRLKENDILVVSGEDFQYFTG